MREFSPTFNRASYKKTAKNGEKTRKTEISRDKSTFDFRLSTFATPAHDLIDFQSTMAIDFQKPYRLLGSYRGSGAGNNIKKTEGRQIPRLFFGNGGASLSILYGGAFSRCILPYVTQSNLFRALWGLYGVFCGGVVCLYSLGVALLVGGLKSILEGGADRDSKKPPSQAVVVYYILYYKKTAPSFGGGCCLFSCADVIDPKINLVTGGTAKLVEHEIVKPARCLFGCFARFHVECDLDLCKQVFHSFTSLQFATD